MGMLQKFSRLWASINDTNKADPDDALTNKVINGMGDDQQMPYPWYNWELDRIERRVQDMTQYSPGPMPPGLTRDQLVQKHFSSALQDGRYWGHMYDDINTINMGSDDILDLALYYPPGTDNAPILLMLNGSDNTIYWYNTVTGETGDSGALADLPSGGGEVWEARQFMSDNYYVYVTFYDSGAGPATRMQAYSLVDWTKRAAWPGTGVGFTAANQLYEDRIIDIDDTNICYLNNGIVITAINSAVINMINKADGVVTDFGAGDAPTGVGFRAQKSLTTDGQYVYFTVHQPAQQSKVCSADVTDLTQGIGAGGWPATPIAANGLDCGDLNYDGNHIISIWYQRDTDLGFLYLHTQADASHSFYSLGGDLDDYYIFNACFDGRNLWLRGDHKNDDKPIVFSLNVGAFSKHYFDFTGLAEPANPYVDRIYAFAESNTYTLIDDLKRMVFDGSNIWAISYSLAGVRVVRRIPNVAGV